MISGESPFVEPAGPAPARGAPTLRANIRPITTLVGRLVVCCRVFRLCLSPRAEVASSRGELGCAQWKQAMPYWFSRPYGTATNPIPRPDGSRGGWSSMARQSGGFLEPGYSTKREPSQSFVILEHLRDKWIVSYT